MSMCECNILNEGYHFVKDYGYCEVIWGDLKSKNFHVLPQDFFGELAHENTTWNE